MLAHPRQAISFVILLIPLLLNSVVLAAEPLTLESAVSRALQRDALVQSARSSLDSARASYTSATAYTPTMSFSSNTSSRKSQGFDPESTITGTESSSYSFGTGVNIPFRGGTSLSLSTGASSSTSNTSVRGEGDESYTYAGASIGASLSTKLPIFRNERVLTEGPRWSAEIGLKSAELAFADARRNVVNNTLYYFYNALKAQRSAEISAASLRNAEEQLRIAKEKFALGKIPEIDLMDSEINADSARVGLASAQAAAADSLDSLKDFLGLPLDEPVELSHNDPTDFTLEPLDEEALFQHALVARADLLQNELGIKSADLSLRQTEAYAKPGVTLSGGYSRSGEGETISDSYRRFINPSWNVGIYTSVSLSRKEDRIAIDNARRSLEDSKTNKRLAEGAVRLEIRRLIRALQNDAANLIVLEKSVKQAEESLRIAQLQFSRGLKTALDVSQSEYQLNSTRLSFTNALINFQLSKAGLYLAIGEMPFPLDSDQVVLAPNGNIITSANN